MPRFTQQDIKKKKIIFGKLFWLLYVRKICQHFQLLAQKNKKEIKLFSKFIQIFFRKRKECFKAMKLLSKYTFKYIRVSQISSLLRDFVRLLQIHTVISLQNFNIITKILLFKMLLEKNNFTILRIGSDPKRLTTYFDQMNLFNLLYFFQFSMVNKLHT